LALVEAIAVVVREGPRDAEVSVMSDEQFPLSWYLRDVRAGYPGKVERFAGAMIVARDRQEADLEAMVGDTFHRVGRYRLRPGVRLSLYVRADLAGLLAGHAPPAAAACSVFGGLVRRLEPQFERPGQEIGSRSR
jgi:hypothetical protein